MTLLTVVQDVAAVVGVAIPQAVIPGITGNRTMQEMLALANEMAARIASDEREWTALKGTATHTGDGIKEAFDLSADYGRMLKTSNVWRSTSTAQPMRFFPDFDEWVRRRASNYTDASGEWTMYGGQMHIWPIMPVGVTAKYGYLKNTPVRLATSGYGSKFMGDGDVFILGERLLTLGMIWQWKANKGAAYAEDLGTYADALSVAMGSDLPAPIIIGRKPVSAAVSPSYPWPVPT